MIKNGFNFFENVICLLGIETHIGYSLQVSFSIITVHFSWDTFLAHRDAFFLIEGPVSLSPSALT